MTNPKTKPPKGNLVQRVLFSSKFLLVPFYFGLIVAQILYCYKFVEEVIHLLGNFTSMTESNVMLSVLTLIDVTMVANLIKMIITGSYQSFVEKIPENTEKVSSGLLKVKLSTSLIGVSSIHLLQTFISPHGTDRELAIKFIIHGIFILGSVALAYIDFLHSKSELLEAQAEHLTNRNHNED